MKSEHDPPSDSTFASFKDTMRKILRVSKSELDEIRREEAAKKQRLAKAKRPPAV
jgi:hypothetical protein